MVRFGKGHLKVLESAAGRVAGGDGGELSNICASRRIIFKIAEAPNLVGQNDRYLIEQRRIPGGSPN